MNRLNLSRQAPTYLIPIINTNLRVIFIDKDTGRVAIYYGCADTVTGLVFGKVDGIVAWIKANKI